jgi:hypothetical protein
VGPLAAIPGLPDRDREHGRGLLNVTALATRWGQRRTATGLTVWALTGTPGDAVAPAGSPA